MAKEISFQDEFGEVYPDAYFRVVQVNINRADKNANIVLYGYKDAENKGKRIIGQKSYAIKSDEFDNLFSAEAMDEKNVIKAAYEVATSTKDMEILDGQELKKVSFFEEASDV